jgi:hypothetical protein
VSGRSDQFSPANLPPELWEQIRPQVQAWLAAAKPPTRSVESAWRNAVTQLLVFCIDHGLSTEAAVAFSPPVVEHFIAVGCAHLNRGTRTNYRGQLRTVGERVLGPEACPGRTVPIRGSDPASPYSAAEQASLVAWANGLSTGFKRHNAKALLVLGLSAGLSSLDISVLVGTDVVVGDHGVVIEVPGPNRRSVPVLRRWEADVAELAALCGERPMFRSARERINRKDISNFLESCRESEAPKLSVQRLRVTWIVHHLAAHTPVRALLPAAGVSAKQLARYYRFVPSPTVEEAHAALREAGRS